MNFTSLLIETCTIQSKTLNTSNYEKIDTWTDVATDVPCRHEDSGVKIQDSELRINTDDDLFFFNPDVTISRDNRIVYDGKNYSVIKVSKLRDSTTIHHLEVIARFTDHK